MRTAVIGVGSMGRNHARVLYDLPNAKLVAVCDNEEKTADSVAKRYQCKAYTDHKMMLQEEKPDVVVVAVPTMLHKEVAIDAFEAGCHVMLEKPIAGSLAEADEIIAAAKKTGKKLMIGHIERFNPAIIALKERLKKGELGKVYKIDVNRAGPFPARIRDVGVVVDLAVHDIDIMRYLSGSEVVRVHAECEKRIHTDHEDLLSGLLKFENNMICMLNINWLTPTKIRKLYITGEKGMFVADYLKQDLYFYENDKINDVVQTGQSGWSVSEGRMVKYHIAKVEPLRSEIEHFLSCVEKGTDPMISGADGKEALKLALALIEANSKGEVVKP